MEVLRGTRVGRKLEFCQDQTLVVPTVFTGEKVSGTADAWIGHRQGDCIAEGRHLAFGELREQQFPPQMEVLRGA